MKDYLASPVSQFPSYRVSSDTAPSLTSTLGGVLGMFKNGTHRADIEALRALRDQDEGAYKDRKKALPAYTLSGQFSGRSNTRLIQHSGVVCLDVDKGDDPGAELERLKASPHVLAVGRSAGGVGLFAIVPVDPVPENSDQHRQAFDQVCEALDIEGSADTNVKDVARLRGCTYDPDLHVNRQAQPVRVSYANPERRNGQQLPRERAGDRDPVEEVREVLRYITERPDYDDWVRISSGVLEKLGGDIDMAEQLLIEWRPEEVQGEYREKLEHPLTKIRFGSVVYRAKKYGYDPRQRARISSPGGDGRRGTPPRIDIEPAQDDGFSTGEDGFSTGGLMNTDKPETAPDDGSGDEQGRYGLTDLGNAERLIRDHGDDLRYCYRWKAWIVWNGRQWRRDEGAGIERRAKRSVRKMQRDAAAIEDADRKTKLFKHAVSSEANKRIQALIALAQSEPGVPIEPDELDRGEWLLNVNNGTLDLSTGHLREHRREDLITKMAPVSYDPDATCLRFEQFLREVFIGADGKPDDELIGYVQRVLGYALTASVREQVFFILHGIGANGKGTLLDVVQDILGDYAGEARSELLMRQKRQAAAPSEDEADLHGRRVVKASETDAGRAFSEALVKRLTGGDRITARRLHGHNFTFPPTHKLFLLTNHKPEIIGTDYAIWRRVHMIPFNACFEGNAADPTLKDKLLTEAPGILNWLLQGCLTWQREGLQAPAAVIQATNDYRESMDKLAQFLDDRVTIFDDGVTGRIGATPLYQAYRAWCTDNGEAPETQTRFGERMAERGMPKKRTKAGQVYTGIALQPTTGSEESGRTPF